MAKKMTVVLSDEEFEEMRNFVSNPVKHSDFDVYCMFHDLVTWAHFEECEPMRVESWWLEKQDGVWGENNGKTFRPIEFTPIQQAVIKEMIKEAVEQHD